jgi:glycosyltransferase involved in cell wall biosynthesis
MEKHKLIRITTIPLSLDKLLSGQLKYMNNFYEVITVSSDIEYLKKIGLKENVKTFALEMSRKITPIYDLIAVVKLFFFLKKEKPLIVHSHTPKAGILSMIAAKCAGVPIRLHTVAGLPLMEAKGLKRNILESVEKLTYSCATLVYPNSRGLYDFILDNKFINKNKIKIIANGSTNGIDTNYFSNTLITEVTKAELKDKLGITIDDFVFIFVGRLVGDKGINELVSAFNSVLHTNSNVKLLLVGSEENELDPLQKSTLYEITTNKSIISVGYQKDVRPYMAISNSLVFPSYREGFPNAVMQAGAMGLPSIVTNINGCNEIIINNVNGIIIEVKNSTAIENAMCTLYNNPILYNKLRNASRDLITSRYDQINVWNCILQEYKQLEINLITKK